MYACYFRKIKILMGFESIVYIKELIKVMQVFYRENTLIINIFFIKFSRNDFYK